MTVLDLVEGGAAVEVELAPELGQLLAASDAVTAAPSIVPGWWTVAPAGKVGVVRIGGARAVGGIGRTDGVEVWVRPKLDIHRLVFLLGYATDAKGWRDTDVPLASAPGLLPALAHAFARQAQRALAGGVLQGYRTVQEALPVVRGRIRIADQLRYRFGLPLPVEVSYDEFTIDITENRLLRAAAERLLRVPRIGAGVRRMLHRLSSVTLADVSHLPARGPAPAWEPTRLNARYAVALRLAELVLAAESFEHERGDVRTTGFLFDMAKVFEDFVSVALREALAPWGGRVAFQYRTDLDEAGLVPMYPDIVWVRDGAPVAVLDAKYKAEKPSGFPQADLYQMHAYCTVLGLDTGHLVYARGNEFPARHRVVGSGTTIVCHALDLDQSPAQVLSDVAGVAAAATATARSAAGSHR